jgi:hypothetical protein
MSIDGLTGDDRLLVFSDIGWLYCLTAPIREHKTDDD